MSCRYVTVPKFSELTGYTESAIRGKMNNGVWIEGINYRRAPDSRLLMDMEAYQQWVEKGVTQGLKLAARA